MADSSVSTRLDVYVVQKLPNLSRSSAAKLIESGGVKINGQIQTKAGYKLRSNDNVEIVQIEVTDSGPELDLPVIYEDDDCVVINKPTGVLSHSKGAFNPESTVATWLESRWQGPASERAGIVHRLDRATSGVMIGAKNPAALSWLQKQFSLRKVKKTYVAVVAGQLEKAAAMIDMPIERNPKRPQTFRVGAQGKSAITTYKVVARSDQYSLLELVPQTGRTHQLRVHLKQLGHPIVGDDLYAGQSAERLFLHATSLEITLPNRRRKVFEAKIPKDFKELLA